MSCPPRLPRARTRPAAPRTLLLLLKPLWTKLSADSLRMQKGVPAAGRRLVFNLSGVTTLNMFPHRALGGFDSATESTSAAASAAGAGIEIMSTQYTHVDLTTLGGRLTE